MGRYIECEINNESLIVWKYKLGEQPSEMHRINTEWEIGEYQLMRYIEPENFEDLLDCEYITKDEVKEEDTWFDGDVLILVRDDIPKLRAKVQSLKVSQEANPEKWFITMIENSIKFMEMYSQQDRFIFEGEF